ncbi:hypothetical protein [Allosphingosinicella sp.]|uniref:hypothetical protein n=1 Tax=Allosphingosinicella sp. TaxID=2823234 RepID=UPI003783141A
MDDTNYKEEGRIAFLDGLKALDVPYPDWARRAPWIRGWYEAEHASRINAPVKRTTTKR